SVGFAASLLLQERLLALTPPELSGQALGLGSSGTLAMQGAGAAVAGGIAQLTSPATGMAVVAGLSAAVTLALAPGLGDRYRDGRGGPPGAGGTPPGRGAPGARAPEAPRTPPATPTPPTQETS
ncbi:MFS transporter, partial [Streptomyces sp. NPDC059346]